MGFLAQIIVENTQDIRLDAGFERTIIKGKEHEHTWRYEYQVLDREGDFEITVGKERIYCNGECVFVHVFVISPVNP